MRIRFLAKKQAKPIQELSDAELVEKYRSEGDASCIAVLMDRYAGQIIAFGLKQLNSQADVRDFANDVYLKLADKLKSSEPQQFKPWLYTVMRNMCHDQGRRQQLNDVFVQSQQGREDHVVEEHIDAQIDYETLHEALDELPPKEAQVIRLIYLEENNYQEAMQVTGLTFNQLRGIRNRGMTRLKAIIQKRMSR